MANEYFNKIAKFIGGGKFDDLKDTKNLKQILTERDSKGRTVLIVAAEVRCPHKRYSRCIELVLNRGADPNAADCNGDTAAHMAARWGNLQMLALLPFEAKFLPNGENCTPLMEAVQKCRFRCVKHLLHLFRQKRYFGRKSSLLGLKNKKGMTAMDIARAVDIKPDIRQDMVEIIENEFQLTVDDEGKIDGLSNKQRGIFERMKRLAIEGNHTELQQVATRVHCDLSDSTGRTALSWAAESDIRPSRKMQLTLLALIDIGDPTAADVNGDTSLHYAALRGRMHTAGLLIEQGVPVNTRDAHDQTPAMWAATPPSQVGVTLLTLESMGADLALEDSEGRTALVLSKTSTSNPALLNLTQAPSVSSTTMEEEEHPPRSSDIIRSNSTASLSSTNSSNNSLDSTLRSLRRFFGRSRWSQSTNLRRGSTAPSRLAGLPEHSLNYDTTSPGLIAIFNICDYDCKNGFKRRTGSNSDVKQLKRIAAELKVDVVESHDKSADEMSTQLDSLANDCSRLQNGYFICVIMAHGKEGGKLIARDGKTIKIKDIVNKFNSSNCPALQHKPKVFIIQACRGKRMDIQRTASRVSLDAGPSEVTSSYCPVESDILIFYSATEGSASYRSETEEEGSPFIQTLCDVIMEYHRSEHLLDMLTIVNQRLKQTPIEGPQGAYYAVPQFVTQLSAKLYL